MNQGDIQLNKEGKLKHFLSIEGLNRQTLIDIMDTAENFATVGDRQIKKIPLLRGKTITNLFFEASTRTRTTFELAAKRLSADILNININTSSTSKGESLLDMLSNLEAMHCDMFVVRHSSSGAAHFIAKHVSPNIGIINGGDGSHAHPTQAMLDMFTIRRHKGDFKNLRVAVVGDILHSRVARSEIHALNVLGVPEIRVIGPHTLIPPQVAKLGVHIYHDMQQGLKDIDVIMMLRLQRERMLGAYLPSPQEYFQCYGLTQEKLNLAKPDAIVMHPGPINRGVEIDSLVVDGNQTVILEQVSHGIAIRMAVMSMILGKSPDKNVSEGNN